MGLEGMSGLIPETCESPPTGVHIVVDGGSPFRIVVANDG
jgi:hypothetical protein